ncbi:IS66 family transposase [Bacteroides finegoldii]|uniref:IS66 family transposase n=1 Tax=Bacteroides finegoldii TaxID=338188 RepID=UPI0022E2F98E|nr:transposase [Bacteroides finegoldii]
MTAHDLYTRTLSDYKSCLCSSPALTLRSYCRERHVNYHGMCLWLSRHGISIRELHPSSPDMLYGVTITFPDGVTVSIKQGSPFSVNRFIDRYNSKIQEEESCLVELTNKLYQKEHEHCVGRQGWTDKDNLRHRKRYVPQILSEIKRELLRIKSKPDLLPKSEMAGAVDYMLLQWEAIKGIFTEGYYYLDNNLVERYNRYISLSRRNSLFFGSHKGAERGALFYSPACSCRMQGINTFEYITKVINKAAKLPPNTDIKVYRNLLPDKWKENRSRIET